MDQPPKYIPDPDRITTLRDLIARVLDTHMPARYRRIPANEKLRAVAWSDDPLAETILLHGPPGTGKTAQSWALVRERIAAWLLHRLVPDGWDTDLDQPVEVTHRQGGWDNDRPVPPGTFARLLPESGDVGSEVRVPHSIGGGMLISEPGDILRNRFNRTWLDAVAKFDGLLVVDDVGCIPTSEWAVECIYMIANHRSAHRLQTVWSTNWTPDQLADRFSPAIASRMCAGIPVPMEGPDKRLA